MHHICTIMLSLCWLHHGMLLYHHGCHPHARYHAHAHISLLVVPGGHTCDAAVASTIHCLGLQVYDKTDLRWEHDALTELGVAVRSNVGGGAGQIALSFPVTFRPVVIGVVPTEPTIKPDVVVLHIGREGAAVKTQSLAVVVVDVAVAVILCVLVVAAAVNVVPVAAIVVVRAMIVTVVAVVPVVVAVTIVVVIISQVIIVVVGSRLLVHKLLCLTRLQSHLL
jgi:hypothetical protein